MPLLNLFRSLTGRRYGRLLLALAAMALLIAHAPSGRAQNTQFHDSSALRPPAGARVAIVEFDDMECPACAEANPILMRAVAQYRIPWIRHDFLIPYHIWSPMAAVYARWFDQRNKELGNDYRNQVFAHQQSIETRPELIQFTGQFAQSHGIALPFSVDPQGRLAAEVQQDVELGKRVGIQQTPTIFIVMAHAKGAPYIHVQNTQTDLYRDIDRAMDETR